MKNTGPVSQEKLVAFLSDPRSYPRRPRCVRVIQTHTSYLILAAPYAYKVKKPVNLGFLDFSTLEKRRHFCERELLLNRRLCPGSYLDVVPISLKAGKLAFGPGGKVVEYAVKMRKLQDRYFLLHLLQQGRVGSEELDRIVSTLTAFYKAQHPTEEITAWGRLENLKTSTDENFRQTEAFIGSTLSRPAFEAIRAYTGDFYAHHTDLFDSRLRDRWIRDCHGDLHLEHIHLSPSALSIYDCIEFNDRFRYIDVANDVAFLAMDFDHHGRPDLSGDFARRMAGALGDKGMPYLLNFYKCYRAYVRGKVESFRQKAVEVPEPEQKEGQAQAKNYFRLALRYAVCGSEPMVLIVAGRVGSGKSTLAGSLGDELGCEIFSSDRTRKRLAGVPIYERGTSTRRRRLYSEAMTNKTYQELLRCLREPLKEGRGLIIDATFSRRAHRDRLREQLEDAGVPYCFVEAQASTELLKTRLKEREGRSDEVSDARFEDFEVIDRSYEPPAESEFGAHRLIIVSTEHSLEATVTEALKALTQRSVSLT
jgi:aminoglycoside phosphotransferase family enzyme/predicted kinase